MNNLIDELRKGNLVFVGRGVYGRCNRCGCLVKVNKILFGSLHLCTNNPTRDPSEQRMDTEDVQEVETDEP